MKPPFPWFGGKGTVASIVWDALGDARNYVEPFAGSAAVLLRRPAGHTGEVETINDVDAHVANFWRCLSRGGADEVARWADWPVSEVDLEARHKWLCTQPGKGGFARAMKDDPDLCDPKRAGWWVWGQCSWIGAGWCEGHWYGPGDARNAGKGVNVADPERGGKRPHLGNAGKGIHRTITPAADGPWWAGSVERHREHLRSYMAALADRLRRVRVCCGDWSRVCGPAVTFTRGLTGVFLDPPYSAKAQRDANIYTHDDLDVAHAAAAWAIETGRRPDMRIVLAGYEGEHEMPRDWRVVAWTASGGYSSDDSRGGENRRRERLWLSPACLATDRTVGLWEGVST